MPGRVIYYHDNGAMLVMVFFMHDAFAVCVFELSSEKENIRKWTVAIRLVYGSRV